MLIVDIKKSVPLDVSRMDWNPHHVATKETEDEHTITISLYDVGIMKEAGQFAYDIASRQLWTWPDQNDITTAIVCDVTRSHPRFSLRVGVRPAKNTDDEITKEWAEFEAQRREAVQQYEQIGGGEVYALYPVMLAESEEHEVRRLLFDKLDIY